MLLPLQLGDEYACLLHLALALLVDLGSPLQVGGGVLYSLPYCVHPVDALVEQTACLHKVVIDGLYGPDVGQGVGSGD